MNDLSAGFSLKVTQIDGVWYVIDPDSNRVAKSEDLAEAISELARTDGEKGDDGRTARNVVARRSPRSRPMSMIWVVLILLIGLQTMHVYFWQKMGEFTQVFSGRSTIVGEGSRNLADFLPKISLERTLARWAEAAEKIENNDRGQKDKLVSDIKIILSTTKRILCEAEIHCSTMTENNNVQNK